MHTQIAPNYRAIKNRLLADIALNGQIYYIVNFSSSSEAKVGQGIERLSESLEAVTSY